MRVSQKAAFILLAALVFIAAFMLGKKPPRAMAQSDSITDAQDTDNNADDNARLPADVRSRLVRIAPGGPQDFRPAVTFWEVLGKVKTRYVDKITDQDHLTHGAVASMLRSLRDPYSRVIKPEELQLDQQEAAGQFNGVGVVLGARLSGERAPVQDSPGGASGTTTSGPPRRQNDAADRAWQLVIVDTVPGGAAAQAGLETGDIVTRINNQRIERQPLAAKTIDDLNLMLNGPTTHEASLTVTRGASARPMEIHMQGGGSVHIPMVEARTLAHGVTYVRIRLFTPTTPDELAAAIGHLPVPHGNSLLLDLRDNPGGLLSSAQGVVGMLAPPGTAGLLDSHAGSQKLLASSARPMLDFTRLAVLVDAGTANAAE
ncbi:MAG: S41 family peptidase, partial [Armatimonadota bacterium]|nr:S41 family peptidase [Armatimonadota bacterium]